MTETAEAEPIARLGAVPLDRLHRTYIEPPRCTRLEPEAGPMGSILGVLV